MNLLLTPRENTIAALVTQGMRNKEIGNIVGLTEGTVKVYISKLLQKLGYESRTQLALALVGGSIPGQLASPGDFCLAGEMTEDYAL